METRPLNISDLLKFGLLCSQGLPQSCHLEIFLHCHPEDSLCLTFMLNLLFLAFHVFLSFLTPLLLQSLSSSNFLGSKLFETLNIWKCIYSTLIYCWPKDSILGWKYFTEFWRHLLHILTVFFPLPYNVHVFQQCCWEVWCHFDSYLWVGIMCSLFSLKAFKTFSLSPIFCNVTPVRRVGLWQLLCWVLNGPSQYGNSRPPGNCPEIFPWWCSPFHFSFFVDSLWLGCWASSTDTLIFFYFLSLLSFFLYFLGVFFNFIFQIFLLYF